MRGNESTGWRPAPAVVFAAAALPEIDKDDLFKAARLAGEALKLRPALRQVLDYLVGCFKEPIGARMLVWPSNEAIMERTGLSERAARYAVAGLVRLGVISSKDSANGKRFAIRSKSGQILDAFGLDLAPLAARVREFKAAAERRKEEREQRRRAFDEITILRRKCQALLDALAERDEPLGGLVSAFDALTRDTPRRDSKARPDASLARWGDLHDTIDQLYQAACGGKNCRLIESNKDAPDQSCPKGQGTNVSLVDLVAVCPDALSYADPVRTEGELVAAAAKLRGVFGTHESAWQEACDGLGRVRAAGAFMVALQRYCEDQAGRATIRNFGGYFRAWARRMAAGEVDLAEEIRAMRRKRAH